MREKLVKRFYCDHCGKGRFHRAAMVKHEAACVYNPQRKCPLCEEAKFPQSSMPDLINALEACPTGNLDRLRFMANSCPACMLAAIVQCRTTRDGEWTDFSYKAELQDWYQSQDVYSL